MINRVIGVFRVFRASNKVQASLVAKLVVSSNRAASWQCF